MPRTFRAPPAGTGAEWGGRQPGHSARTGSQADLGATVALLVLTLASAVGLTRAFTGHSWEPAIILTAVGVHAACWATRRLHLPIAVAAAIDVLAGWLLVGWTVFPGSTTGGLPLGRTWSAVSGAVTQARDSFSTAIPPVPASPGFKLLAVLGVAVIAIVADWAAFRWRSSLYGAAGPFAYFVVCCTVSGGQPGRGLVIAIEVAALLVFLLAHRTLVSHVDAAWFGNERKGLGRWAATWGGIAAAAALVGGLAVIPLIGNSEGRGILGWRGGVGGGGGPRVVANPIVDLHTRLIQLSNTPVFTVTSPVASYWRLTSLDTFNGEEWSSINSYRGLGTRLPGVQAVPPKTRVEKESFTIQQLDSVWLPDAFTPVSVTGVKGVSYDPSSGSLITSRPTANGLTYSVDSYQYLSSLSAADLRAAPPPKPTAALAPDLQVPADIPAAILNLATTITAGKTTEYDKALALQDYFLGPSYTYTTDPPDDGFGVQALYNFLFVTKEGYCQQFAGAYAALARAVGLPTRLAVGFATGTPNGHGGYQVIDADAHTWPEVYFGPSYGWIPFEPTKSFSDPESKGYAPGTAAGTTSPSPSGSTPNVVKPHQGGSGTGSGSTLPATSKPTTPVVTAGTNHGSALSIWVVLGGILGFFVVWAVIVVSGRRLRWWFRRYRARGHPAGLIQARWADVIELLAWWGTPTEFAETDMEFGRRAALAAEVRLPGHSVWLRGRIARLAALASEAAFAPVVVPVKAEEAHQLAVDIRRELFRAAPIRMLLRWILLPHPRPVLMDARKIVAAPARS